MPVARTQVTDLSSSEINFNQPSDKQVIISNVFTDTPNTPVSSTISNNGTPSRTEQSLEKIDMATLNGTQRTGADSSRGNGSDIPLSESYVQESSNIDESESLLQKPRVQAMPEHCAVGLDWILKNASQNSTQYSVLMNVGFGINPKPAHGDSHNIASGTYNSSQPIYNIKSPGSDSARVIETSKKNLSSMTYPYYNHGFVESHNKDVVYENHVTIIDGKQVTVVKAINNTPPILEIVN